MGIYRARDLLLVPSLVSLTRVPLAALFPWCLGSPVAAVGVLAVAGLSDVIDGWYARRFDQATPIGAVIDGATDKVFVLTVVGTLLASGQLGVVELLLLATRELGELPLVAWWAVSHHQRHRKATAPKANVPGKLATVLQFAAVGAIVAELPEARLLVYTAALMGAAAAVIYWRRELAAQ
jgi:CDP-diacylglycerol--glycerol-3-phosphate 3-phosphatidyltransferase/cardiolipin synthase